MNLHWQRLSPGVSGVLALFLLAGCERGCARSWLGEHGVGQGSSSSGPAAMLNAVDCPDGLARCSEGAVEVSRLASIPQPCKGPSERCACPWERVGECPHACAADGTEVVMDRRVALVQLCAPLGDAGIVAMSGVGISPHGCDEGEAYRCSGGVVVACAANASVASCARGCVAEGASIEDDVPMTREAAFAILCLR